MTENERFYDEEIAPQLRELALKCQAHGVPFAACVEFDPGAVGATIIGSDRATNIHKLVAAAIDARGNIDALFIALARWARKTDRTGESLVLTLLDEIGGLKQ